MTLDINNQPTTIILNSNTKKNILKRIKDFSFCGWYPTENLQNKNLNYGSDITLLNTDQSLENNLHTFKGWEFKKDLSKSWYIDNYNKFNASEKFGIILKFCKYQSEDFSDCQEEDFKDIDHLMYVTCKEHGDFISTPRRLIKGDVCKWCDGIEKPKDSDLKVFKLNRKNRLNEKLYTTGKDYKILRYTNPLNILWHNPEEGCFKQSSLREILQETNFQYSKDYNFYLKNIRKINSGEYQNTNNNLGIIFKLNLIDKSSKFQFSIFNTFSLDNYYLNQDLYIKNSSEKVEPKEIIQDLYKALAKNFEIEIVYFSVEHIMRAYLLFQQYSEYNQNKKLTLPYEIYNKIPEKEYSGFICYSSESWESTSRSISLLRESLMSQSEICKICNKPIEKPVVDHQHIKKVRGSGRIRDCICSNCNVFIAKSENNAPRYGISKEQLPEILKNVSEYFKTQQYNIIHYSDKKKPQRISKTEINKIIKFWPILYPNRKLPTIPKSGTLTKDFKIYQEALENYLKNPYPNFPKKLWTEANKQAQLQNKEIPEYPKIHKVITPEWDKILRSLNVY